VYCGSCSALFDTTKTGHGVSLQASFAQDILLLDHLVDVVKDGELPSCLSFALY